MTIKKKLFMVSALLIRAITGCLFITSFVAGAVHRLEQYEAKLQGGDQDFSLYETRFIQPPSLDDAHLGRRIVCHRPMRRGSPHMAVEKVGDKIVAHNYGHGGSGLTLSAGSARYVITLLEQSVYAQDLKKETPITIIGAGALGLFSAYELVQRGYKKITIVAERFENLTSHNAGGLVAPVSMDNDPALQSVIDQIGIEAYKFFASIARKEHPHFTQGAVIVPTYFETREESGLEPYVGKVMQPAKDVVLDFGNGTKRIMAAYDDGIFIDTTLMMQSLHNYLTPYVTFEQRKITSFEQISDAYIINCTGLGAFSLNNDQAMVSVQGHLIMLKEQKPEQLQYMLLVYLPGQDVTSSGKKIKRSVYVFPKKDAGSTVGSVGVIGGTFIEGATSETPHEEEFSRMIENVKRFYGLTP